MAILKDILYKVSLTSTRGKMDIAIDSIQFDSRLVGKGDLFVAVKGTQSDGHKFIGSAITNGAVAVICEEFPEKILSAITYIRVKNSAEALGRIASNFYNNPSEKLTLVAVTGTNGKTTTVTLLFQLFRRLGYNSGMLSTVQNQINENILTASHTTPDAVQLNKLLVEMVKSGCTHCFMEASSHAIEQRRIVGLDIDVAVFTNITHDHLDYHKTFDNYINAKKQLFNDLPGTKTALINADDKRGSVMMQNTKATGKTYAIKNIADYRAKILSNTMQGLELEINDTHAWFQLTGEFNAYNLLAVYAVAVVLGEDPIESITVLSSIEKIPGRFELITHASGIHAIVDYAHTPDALQNILGTIDALRTGNEMVITVVGCGGNRDKEKRPIMAAIACKFSDKVILTSDNPRNEEPEAIIEDMQKGISSRDQKKTLNIVNRREAIKTACNLAVKDDIVLIAGKGHETYQEIKGVKYDFDDRKVVREILDLLNQ